MEEVDDVDHKKDEASKKNGIRTGYLYFFLFLLSVWSARRSETQVTLTQPP